MFNFASKFFILSLFFIFVKSDIPEDYKCFDPTSEKLKVGEEVILCIHIIRKDFQKEKVGIRIKVDEYSVVSLDGIYDKYNEAINHHKGNDPNNFNLELLAQIGKITSVFTSVSHNIIINFYSNIFMKEISLICLI
jgi:hypothetical protein